MKTAFNNGKRLGVQAVRRALGLLEALAGARESAALADLSKHAGLNKSTTYQLLATLHSLGFVEQEDESRRYRLGLKVVEIARSFLDNSELIARSEPLLREIRDLTGETAGLYLRRGDHRVTVARVESPHAIRRSVSVGEAAPLVRGASGKVILAFLSVAEAGSIGGRAATNGGSARTARATLRHELRQIRARGFALTFGEHVPGAFGIAVPLLDAAGEVVGSLGLSGPIERLTPALRRKGVDALRRAAMRLSPATKNHDTAIRGSLSRGD